MPRGRGTRINSSKKLISRKELTQAIQDAFSPYVTKPPLVSTSRITLTSPPNTVAEKTIKQIPPPVQIQTPKNPEFPETRQQGYLAMFSKAFKGIKDYNTKFQKIKKEAESVGSLIDGVQNISQTVQGNPSPGKSTSFWVAVTTPIAIYLSKAIGKYYTSSQSQESDL